MKPAENQHFPEYNHCASKHNHAILKIYLKYGHSRDPADCHAASPDPGGALSRQEDETRIGTMRLPTAARFNTYKDKERRRL